MNIFLNRARRKQRRNLLLAGAITGLLAGCQAEPPGSDAGATRDPGSALEPAEPADEEPARPEPPVAETEPVSVPAVEATAAPAEPEPLPLDLTLPADLAAGDEPYSAEPERLPDLFAVEKRPSDTSVSGRLYLDEEDQDLRSIQGAEITVQRKLD